MKTAILKRISIAAVALAVGIALAMTTPSTVENVQAESSDPLQFPILLVHGLGEGPDTAFGQLQEMLEAYYFDVEVMDFSEYNGHKLADEKEVGTLANMAAVLAMKVQDMRKKYDVTGISIIAHSYGGLITQAYIMNWGETFGKKFAYDNDVFRVAYIQVPFYGSTMDEKDLEDLVSATDYGNYTDKKAILETMELGSEALFKLFSDVAENNPYKEDVPAMTMVSRDDELFPPEMGMLGSLITRDNDTFNRFRVFKNFSHATSSTVSTAGTTASLAYVETIFEENFITIVSFLDEGTLWQELGDVNFTTLATMMVQIDENGGKLNGKEVSLSKAKSNNRRIKAEQMQSYYNKKARTTTFWAIPPGKYTLSINNPVGNVDDLEVEFEYDGAEAPVQQALHYDARENLLTQGGERVGGSLGGIFGLEQLVFTKSSNQEEASFDLEGLDTNGFFIEFKIRNLPADVNKPVIFSLYSKQHNAGIWRDNGSRFSPTPRGVNSSVRWGGGLTMHLTIDKNKDGAVQHLNEAMEAKSPAGGYNWQAENHFRIEVWTGNDNRCYVKFIINGSPINWTSTPHGRSDGGGVFSKGAPYYNPAPIVSFGGRYHDDKYQNPTGAVITDFVVGNMKK